MARTSLPQLALRVPAARCEADDLQPLLPAHAACARTETLLKADDPRREQRKDPAVFGGRKVGIQWYARRCVDDCEHGRCENGHFP